MRCRSHECLFQTVIHTLSTASWFISDLCHYSLLSALTATAGVFWIVKSTSAAHLNVTHHTIKRLIQDHHKLAGKIITESKEHISVTEHTK